MLKFKSRGWQNQDVFVKGRIPSSLIDMTPSTYYNIYCVCVCVFCPQLLLKFHKQQEEIRRLRELVHQRDVRVKQLELEIKNIKNSQAQSSDF